MTSVLPYVLRRAGSTLTLALSAAVSTGCMGQLPPIPGQEAREQAEDDQARKAHFEEAAQTYYDGGKYAQSVVQWRRVLELEPERQKALWGLAKSLEMVGTPPALRESIQIFEKIVNLDWTSPTMGDRKHELMKDFAEAYSQLADYYDQDVRVLKEKLEDPKADTQTLRTQIQTQIAKRNELLSKAIPLYMQVTQISPDNPYAIAGLAKAHLMLGHDQMGIRYARQYIDICVRSQKEWDEKLKDFSKERGSVTEEQRKYFKDRVRGGRDKEMKIRLLLASVLVRDKQYAQAIEEYDRVLVLDPAMPAAYVERAQAYALAGQYRKAVGDLETYLKMTDPVKQRQSRISAAELLEKYRIVAAGQPDPVQLPKGSPPPPARSRGIPPPPPPPVPIPSR